MQAAECQRFLFDDKTPWASPPGSCRFRRADAESAPQSALFFRFEIWVSGTKPEIAGAHRKCPFRILLFSVFRSASTCRSGRNLALKGRKNPLPVQKGLPLEISVDIAPFIA